MNIGKCICLFNYHHNPKVKHFHYPQNFYHHFAVIPPPPNQTTTAMLSVTDIIKPDQQQASNFNDYFLNCLWYNNFLLTINPFRHMFQYCLSKKFIIWFLCNNMYTHNNGQYCISLRKVSIMYLFLLEMSQFSVSCMPNNFELYPRLCIFSRIKATKIPQNSQPAQKLTADKFSF